MTNQTISLVPKTRFGALLSAQRRDQNLNLATLATSSLGAFDVADLDRIEKGRFPLDEAATAKVASLYGVSIGEIIPERKELVVDFGTNRISASGHQMDLQEEGAQEILSKYLSLVYLMRGQEPGSKLVWRDNDLATLSSALRLARPTIEAQLDELVEHHETEIRKWSQKLKGRLVIPGAGLFLATVAAGALVFVGQTETVDQLSSPSTVPEFSSKDAASQLALVESAESINQDASSPEAVGQKAEALIHQDWQTMLPGWKVEYKGDLQGYQGMTNRLEKTIEIYVDADDSPAEVAGVLAHELGHAVDVTYLDNETRVAWLEARGMPSIWWAGEGLDDFSVGAGDFAEAVAHLWTGSPTYSDHGDLTGAQMDFVTDIIADIGN